MICFGDIYKIKKAYNKPIEDHYMVVFWFDACNKRIFYQTLTSRVYKVFPTYLRKVVKEFDFNHKHYSAIQKYINNGSGLNIDETVFINYRDCNFLNRDTYLYLSRVKNDNAYDFSQKIGSDYLFTGKINKKTKERLLVAIKNSCYFSRPEIMGIMDFYKKSNGNK